MSGRDLDFVVRVLGVFADADAHDAVFWWTAREGELIRFYANCNDFFSWATADAEEITPDNVHLLEETATQLRAISWYALTCLIGNVFSGKVRGMRPQTPCYWKSHHDNGVSEEEATKVNALFDSLGPERTRESMG